MLKKFTEGLVFGAGFAISFVAIWCLVAYLIFPMFIGPKIEQEANKHLSELQGDVPFSKSPRTELSPEAVKKASVIALAKYEPAPDGGMKAVIKEFLKKDPAVQIYYNVGDEYRGPSRFRSRSSLTSSGVT